MVSTKNLEPRLWIEKLVIYRSLEPLSVIREINLTRGINIIWGVSPQVPDDAEGTLTGHSVGKTAFCRLARYCLGENTFNRKKTQARIIDCFPEGVVGAQLYLDGQQWAVLRPLGSNLSSRACPGRLDEIITNKLREDNFDSFTTALEQAFLSKLPIDTPPQSEKKFQWFHLLAWLSRDQEARYQSLLQWRSSRSEATPLGFARQQKDPLFFIRMLLGLLDKEEVKLSKKIDKIQKELEPLYKVAEELEQEPSSIINYQEKILHGLLQTTKLPQPNLDLWKVEAQASNAIIKRTGEISEKEAEYRLLEDKISTMKYWIKRWQERREQFGVVADVTKEGTEQPQYEDEDITILKAYFEKICVFGNVEFKNCEYYLQEMALAENAVDIHKPRLNQVSAERDAINKAIIDQVKQIQQTVDNLKKKLDEQEQLLRKGKTDIDNMKTDKNNLSAALAAWQHAMNIIEGTVPNTALNDINTQIIIKEELLDEAKRNLGGLLGRYTNRALEISSLYDKILKSVLSNSYAGKFWVDTEDIHFEIDEGNGEMSGEAVETLALVLADVTAMIWNHKGCNLHPGFLIHDSPREADLDGHVYSRFLKGVFDLMEEYGGVNSPFQYIITTTSEPPSSLKRTNVIRAELKAEPESELLFRQRLMTEQPLL